jgi:hypothetical protein
MAWIIVGREYHNHEYDLLTVHIPYKTCTAVNRYRIRKDEKKVPRDLLRVRKYGETTHLDGSKWIEGSFRRGN